MKIVVAPAAAVQIRARKVWWRKHRFKAPERFDQELADALQWIAARPESFPVHSESAGRLLRRCLLGKSSCHLYFEILASSGEVLIVAARGAVRRRGPRLSGR
jgi:plasmid stabilization system protein ParE